MKTYNYIVSDQLEDETLRPIFIDNEQVGNVRRIYSNKLKKKLDQFFDYRYFLIYEATIQNHTYSVKKIFRRGKLWFEGFDHSSKKKTIITYDNWRIGVPELKIIDERATLKINKEFEKPSLFYEGDIQVASWLATYNEMEKIFDIILIIEENATIQDPAFYITISQATLFIGA